MKTKLLGSLLLAIVMSVGATAVQAETKIGAVSMARLMESAPQVKRASEKIKAEFAEREKQLIDEQDEIKKLQDNYRRDREVMSAAEREKAENALRERVREFKRKSDAFAADFSEARNQALGSLQSDIYKAIVDIAEAENYDLIVSESVLYVSKRIDITDKVIARLQKNPGK